MLEKTRSASPAIPFLGLEETRGLLSERLLSRDWWTFLPLSPEGSALVAQVEQRHYSGDANADFEILMLNTPMGMLSVAFARKTRMSARKLSRLLDAFGLFSEAKAIALGNLDVLAMTELPDVGYAAMSWLERLIANDPQTRGKESCPRPQPL